ncbi:phosphopantetheine-binding protein [Streptomyces sp. NPDC098789]|uniref:phosphopantetheine-binding protein n=1 Tax=Streptomyces sp. NPDC098789 TaxID=3366098 RepID=UPI003808C041
MVEITDVQFNEAMLAQLLTEHFQIEAERVRPEATLTELELDSIAVLELVVVIEETTGVELHEEGLSLGPESTLAEAGQALVQAVAAGRAAKTGTDRTVL